ncbi:MAG: cupin domain-containing protein [Chloroflexia bacterium]|nr:cupin domain-containing protein [Chloroflexia bacterium]
MSHSSSIDLNNIVRRVSESDAVSLSWGRLVWLIGEKETPGAEQTLGVVTIEPGKRNPLHFHPNCEELLYVMEGEADHKLGDEMFHITTGDVIRIPQGVPHWAQATGETPLVALISFSAADRKTENLEDTGDIA